MRISDWSSDVCSSDLQPVGYLVLAQNADDAAHDYSVSVRVERSRDMLAPVPRLRSGRTGAANINPWPFSVPPSLRGTSRPSQAYSPAARARSEERRVGKECVSTCRSRWSPYH